MPKSRKETDWESIEKDYRAGIKTLRVIASEHGITHVAINRRAKRDNWTRDLSQKIRDRADSLVTKGTVTTNVTKDDENAIIEANAQLQAGIILTHRKDIGRYKVLCENLLAELELQTGAIVTFEELGDIMYKPNRNGVDRLNELYMKTISTPSRVDSVKKLVETLKTLIGLEREAFGIDDRKLGGDNKQEKEVEFAPSEKLVALRELSKKYIDAPYAVVSTEPA